MMSSVPQSAVADTDATPRAAREGGTHVLLIGDRTSVVERLRAAFEPHADIDFSCCSEPASVLKVASRIQPTVILQDMAVPDDDGLDLVEAFRAAPDLKDIPIIVLSSKGEAAGKKAAFSAGANDYIVKPPDETEIIARVRYHSHSYRTRRELQRTIDELKKVHDQLFQSEKMASIGLLAAGVAHEINNPIAFVTSNLNSLNDHYRDVFEVLDAYAELGDGASGANADFAPVIALKQRLKMDDIREDIGQIFEECRDGLSRVRKIVDDLKNFSRTSETEWQLADIHDELERTLSIANNELKYKADVIRNYGDLPEIQCIPTRINQVFLNLLVNAAQAMDDRGEITITTSVGSAPKGSELQAAGRQECVCIEVADTGSGIDTDTLSRVFEPFFTTKTASKGTGLGLSVSFGIIQSHNGHIVVDSEPGKGTTFTIWLPVKQHGD